MRHPEFPVVSFLAIPLLLSSVRSHIRARSVATIALLSWLAVLNVIRGINSLIWANNTMVRAEVWCDISTKIVIGFTFAAPLSALCICRHLEHVSSNRQAVITENDKCRRMKFEAMMCFGLPIIFMALHYIVQGHRFDLIEDVGCYPSTYFSVPAVIIVWVPPLVISLISLIYAVASFHHFLQRRIEFATILQSSNSAITLGRYFRLMALAVFEILWDSGTNIYIIYYNTFTGLRPWISWGNVHSNFSRVALFPYFLLPPWAIIQLIWQWWIIPISSIAFFFFFGFGQEAMSDYREAFVWFRRTILRQSVKASSSSTTPTVLPAYQFASDNSDVLRTTSYPSRPEENSWDELSLKALKDIQDMSSNVEPSIVQDVLAVRDYSFRESFPVRRNSGSSKSYVQSEQSTSIIGSDLEPSSPLSYDDSSSTLTFVGPNTVTQIPLAPPHIPSSPLARSAGSPRSPDLVISPSQPYTLGIGVNPPYQLETSTSESTQPDAATALKSTL